MHNDEHLGRDRPEAWAMNYVAASTFMTSFGEMPALAPWQWSIAGDLGYVPQLSEAQQRVGFNGVKEEDLNKTPVFGRLRVMLGLPGAWAAELGYTPPLTIDGAQPHDLFALAIGRRVVEHERFTLSARLFGQQGRVHGDITCPGALAGVGDLEQNPFGCRAPSDDQVTLNYYGADVTWSVAVGAWRVHGALGAVRAELAVQVDALTFGVRDRSRLVSRTVLPFATLGVTRDLDARWSTGLELLYVPLVVRRGIDAPRESDPFAGVRAQLRYRFD
ncbi:MAG TPA: hypothetical protein VF059_09175 [Casimicrobiaceae bacterium]